ncbi:unnamed protein product [Protopolystoma xenopodis]|uniref:CBS domain-containing protein n=1 Tax=Protopolystoma xenopodis TaxID=117903 RepID=A0A448WYM5_9PLAT|nr:unnamed protein product [Protopolystoma xenopodis]
MALLPWEPNKLSVTKRIQDFMSSNVICLRPVMRVRDLMTTVVNNFHHAFPIVVGSLCETRPAYGKLIGLISSEHLAMLLKKKVSYISTPSYF